METSGVNAPHDQRCPSPQWRSSLECPRSGHGLPEPGRRGSRQRIGNRPPEINPMLPFFPSGERVDSNRRLIVPETPLVEDDLLCQHQVDSPAELGGQDAQGLGLATLLLLPPQPLLGPLA